MSGWDILSSVAVTFECATVKRWGSCLLPNWVPCIGFIICRQIKGLLQPALHDMLVAGSNPNTKGVCQNCPLSLRAIPRGAKFRHPALLRFAAPSVCSGQLPLPFDHHCNTK